MRTVVYTTDYPAYAAAWDQVSHAGLRHLNLDTWAAGRRYLSLTGVVLTRQEVSQLRSVTESFSGLLDRAVDGILEDADWWSSLAWPWPAIELARQEPPHPDRRVSLYGRFDCLLDANGTWQIIEYNADTPSGGREASGLEPAIARLYRGSPREPASPNVRSWDHPPLASLSGRVSSRLVKTLRERIQAWHRPVRRVGVVSSHSWIEDMAQATWLGWLLCRAGQPALVGDVRDLAVQRGRISLRGEPIDALYRFYPVERLYRHAIFASLCEAAIDGELLVLNGLRAFLAQSKACLAWLWSNRAALGHKARATIEQHLPATVLARDPEAIDLVPTGVVKHVNGREGDSVVFGNALDAAGWEARLLEGGYVVQHAIASLALEDVEVDDVQQRVTVKHPRYACVGSFAIGGRFGGCYTRLDGPITLGSATYAATLRELVAGERRP